MSSGGFQITKKEDIEPFAEYFDRKITIEKPVDVKDGQGGTTRTWQNVFPGTIWAHMEPWKGREMFTGQQVYPNLFEYVLIRYRKTVNITPIMRMRYKSRTFNIRMAGVPAEARKVIEMLVEELQESGTVA